MTLSCAKKQTLFLTLINGVVRALGLLMRILLSRIAGAEVMGVMELAQSVQMVAIAPVTSGLPAAVTRLTAKAPPGQKVLPLLAGFRLTKGISLFLIPLLWFLSPMIAEKMGDARVLPSLWFTAPCVLVLGYSACCNGYCYGTGQCVIPAVSELIEQVVRVGLTLVLLHFLSQLTAGWIATVPAFATLFAEMVGLVYVLSSIRCRQMKTSGCKELVRPLLDLAAPSTANRLLQTFLRSLTAIVIPIRLQQSGLSAAEATSRLGMYNGMVMPILMLPCIFTSALSMVALPRIATAENQPSDFKRLILKCLSGSLAFSVFCALLILWSAPLLAQHLYRLPELTVLFRNCAVLTVLTAAGHVLQTALSAMGRQKTLLWISCTVSCMSLLLTWSWAGSPALRLHGVILSQIVTSVLAILLSAGGILRNMPRDQI